MNLSETKENLAKLSLEDLEELYERQSKILKNKNIINNLPDKGEQLRKRLRKVEEELQVRNDVKKIEDSLKTLTVQCQDFQDKHTQHICSIEKSPKKERYRPFVTLTRRNEKTQTENLTQLIPLAESITLLAEQANKIPVEVIRKKIETEVEHQDEQEEETYSDVD